MIKRDPNCTLCKLHKTAEFVCLLGQGPKQSDVMIVGEAPGRREDDTGKAFVGKSGQLLESKIESILQMDRDDIFIGNAVNCRPPDNRTPSKGEVKACRVWLDRMIKSVKPKFVLLLGNIPLLSVTGETGIQKKRGKAFEKNGIIYLPTYHPAFLLRDPRHEDTFDKDLALFKEIIEGGRIPQEDDLDYVIVRTRDQFKEMINALAGDVSFDIETTCLYPWGEPKYKKVKNEGKKLVGKVKAKINTIGFGCRKRQYILPVHHKESPWTREEIPEMLDEIEERLDDCDLIAQNGKFDFLWVWVHFNLRWQKYFHFDTMLAHYILDENSQHSLKYLAQLYYGAPDWDVDESTKKGENGLEKLAKYQAHDLFYTRKLKHTLRKELNKDGEVQRVFEMIMMPCARLFTEVEYDGVYLNLDKMDDAEKYLRKELAEAEKEMKKFGDLENWGSPKQLGNFLFGPKKQGGLGIPVIERTAKGGISTSESVIKRIDHPIGGAIIRFRGAKQQLSFFIEGWRPFIVDNRLHPSFKLHGTVTGRLSCEHPNLQQVPRDKRIRSLITAPPGWTLVEADLSQIELRIASELAQERNMLNAFAKGVDVHWLTVLREIERGGGEKDIVLDTARTWKQDKTISYADAFDVLLEMGPDNACEIHEEWKELRKKAKAINFGYLYGMWWKKFKIYARDNYGVNITDEQAEASRKFFFDTYSDYPKWHDRQRRYARLNGYVRSLSGRKRRLPAAMSPQDTPERREAERQAINSPVQSFANELNLMAGLQLRQEFSRNVARIVGTVHDALLVWVKNEHVEKVTKRLLEIMSHPKLMDTFEISVGVPILAEAKIGPWGEGVSLNKWRKEKRR